MQDHATAHIPDPQAAHGQPMGAAVPMPAGAPAHLTVVPPAQHAPATFPPAQHAPATFPPAHNQHGAPMYAQAHQPPAQQHPQAPQAAPTFPPAQHPAPTFAPSQHAHPGQPVHPGTAPAPGAGTPPPMSFAPPAILAPQPVTAPHDSAPQPAPSIGGGLFDPAPSFAAALAEQAPPASHAAPAAPPAAQQMQSAQAGASLQIGDALPQDLAASIAADVAAIAAAHAAATAEVDEHSHAGSTRTAHHPGEPTLAAAASSPAAPAASHAATAVRRDPHATRRAAVALDTDRDPALGVDPSGTWWSPGTALVIVAAALAWRLVSAYAAHRLPARLDSGLQLDRFDTLVVQLPLAGTTAGAAAGLLLVATAVAILFVGHRRGVRERGLQGAVAVVALVAVVAPLVLGGS